MSVPGEGKTYRLTVAEIWKVQLNARGHLSDVKRFGMCTVFFLETFPIKCVDSGGIGAPLESHIAFLPPSTHWYKSLLFTLLVSCKPSFQLPPILVKWNCHLKGLCLLACDWRWKGPIEEKL